MKKSYIIAFLMVAVALGILMSSSDELSTYATFAEAQKSNQKVKVVGKLVKNKAMTYNPEQDPNHFSFYIVDSDGVEKMVVYNSAKPQDFELSEQVVVTGTMREDAFEATDLLLKCPSKYKDEEINIKTKES